MSRFLVLAIGSFGAAVVVVAWLLTVFVAQAYPAVLRIARNGWLVLVFAAAVFLVAHGLDASYRARRSEVDS